LRCELLLDAQSGRQRDKPQGAGIQSQH